MREDPWKVNFEKRFNATYRAALGVLAIFAIGSQILGFIEFSTSETAAQTANLAARQGVLSRQLMDMALLSRNCSTGAEWRKWAAGFSPILGEWEETERSLRAREASPQSVWPVFDRMRASARAMVQSASGDDGAPGGSRMPELAGEIANSGAAFLPVADSAADFYLRESLHAAGRLKTIELLLPAGLLLLLFLLGALIVRPAARKLNLSLEALRDSGRRFQEFMDYTSVVAFMKDEAGRYVYVNRSFRRFFGLSEEEAIGKTDLDLLPPEVGKKIRESDAAVLANNRSTEVLEMVPDAKGEMRHWLGVKFPFVNQSGSRFLGGTSIDISERVRSEEAERASEKRWQLALRGSNDGLWDWNAVTNEVYYSARWKQILGYAENEIPNTPEEWDLRVHPDDLPRVQADLEAHLNRKTPYYISEYRMRCRDGSYRWVLARGQSVWDDQGKLIRMAGSHTDITDRKKAEERLTNEAAQDPLTQLSNRRRLLEQVAKEFQKARGGGKPLCVCLCDIDRFKQVNDDFGHSMGDRVLSTFAQILREASRGDDIAGRLGGDEFCVILPNTRADEAIAAMDRARSRLETMLFAHRDGKPFQVSATFGVAEMTPEHQFEAELMEAADQALYAGKRNGRNRVNTLRRDEKPKQTRIVS